MKKLDFSGIVEDLGRAEAMVSEACQPLPQAWAHVRTLLAVITALRDIGCMYHDPLMDGAPCCDVARVMKETLSL